MYILIVFVVLGGNGDVVSNQENRVETDTKLSDQVGCASVTLLRELLEELYMNCERVRRRRRCGKRRELCTFGSRLGKSTQIANQFCLSHTNTPICDLQCVVFFVQFYLYVQFCLLSLS